MTTENTIIQTDDEGRDIGKELIQNKLKTLTNVIDNISNLMSTQADEQIVRMPEGVFVKVFLPLFAGEEIAEPEKKYATFEQWRAIASSTYLEGNFAPVHVVDHQNVVIFTVPPLFHRRAINPARDRNRHSIFDEIQYTNTLAAGNPIAATNYMMKYLTERGKKVQVTSDLKPYLQAWNFIFKRYGRPLIECSVVTDDVVVKPEGLEDGLTYED